jgi:hypothetical protein
MADAGQLGGTPGLGTWESTGVSCLRAIKWGRDAQTPGPVAPKGAPSARCAGYPLRSPRYSPVVRRSVS